MSAGIDKFIAARRRERQYSEATLLAMERDLAILRKRAGGRGWQALKTADIRSFVADEHRRGLAPASLRRMLSSWRKFFSHLAELGLLEANPAQGVRAPRSGRSLPKALSPDEANALLSTAAAGPFDIRDAAMFETAYSCALRVSELVALDLPDADFAARTVTVRHGKGDKQRIVPLGSKAVDALQRWLPVRAALATGADEAVFVNRNGKRLSARSAQLRIKALALKAGLSGNVTPHMLRHSCASHMLQSSGDLRSVQEMLGHADVSSTQIYTHLDFQSLAKIYDQAHPRARRAANPEAKTPSKTEKNTPSA